MVVCLSLSPYPCRKTLHSQQLFQKLVSFVMSYSFTDAEEVDIFQQTMMVPFVDLLNHHSHHHAELNFQEECLELVAVRSIGKVTGVGVCCWVQICVDMSEDRYCICE